MKDVLSKIAIPWRVCSIGLLIVVLNPNDFTTMLIGSLMFVGGLVERLAIAIEKGK